jgi:type IV pilus assembly protein PilB
MLVDAGTITRQQLDLAEQHAVRHRVPLVEALTALRFVPEAEAYVALSRATGLALIDLEKTPQTEMAVRLVPERLARQHFVVPLRVEGRDLTFATCRPFDDEADRDISFASGRRTAAVLAPRSAVAAALERCYPKLGTLDTLIARLKSESTTIENVDANDDNPGGSAVIDLCNHILARAVEQGASDVHIDCLTDSLAVRYRICGVLEKGPALPAGVSSAVRNRFKILARADISIHHRPQDGAFRIKVNGRPIDVRFSILPTVGGEKIVMRVIDTQSELRTLDSLGYDEQMLASLRRALAHTDGLILVTGPTGSGKTTALYGALAHLRTGATNIVTVEDPVERSLPGVTQIPVTPKSGNTFAAVLRSLLRQDPNVIMVGEVRDAEVAEIIGQAAYTGHLVLSSMHTIDAATAVLRLTNFGLESYKVAESLVAVLAQRLVRSLCPHCRRVHDDVEARRRGRALNLPIVPVSAGPGCPRCNHTGYAGRVPIAEILVPSPELRAVIARGASVQDIRGGMRAAGSPTMHDRALMLVAQGITSIEEVERVLAVEVAPAAAPKPAMRSTGQARHRVLITDDDPTTRMLVKLLLERERFDVIEAATGEDGIERAVRDSPDVVLMDLNMPGIDGFEAIRRLRRQVACATLPIIVLTAEEGTEVQRRVLDLGADDYIVKPFQPEDLVARVQAVFRRVAAAA